MPDPAARLPPLDPEMRAAIQRRLLFAQAYRQRIRALRPHHNERPDDYRRATLLLRLIHWQFARMRRARAVQREIEGALGYCVWIPPWWAIPVEDHTLHDRPRPESLYADEDDACKVCA